MTKKRPNQYTYVSPEARFWKLVDRRGGDLCWEWKGYLNAQGYGHIKAGGVRYFAHRFSYRLAYGDFDQSLFVCHHCDNPKCVRPDHLFVGTRSDNMKDCTEKRRNPLMWAANHNRLKTSCKHGHPFSAKNTGTYKNGFRYCRTCKGIAQRKKRQSITEDKPTFQREPALTGKDLICRTKWHKSNRRNA